MQTARLEGEVKTGGARSSSSCRGVSRCYPPACHELQWIYVKIAERRLQVIRALDLRRSWELFSHQTMKLGVNNGRNP
jgi:hypothetical protein